MADLIGTSGNDRINGPSTEANRIYGLDGNDGLIGGALVDLLDGGKGNDLLSGRAGNDTLLGKSGNDVLNGEDGTDTLDGGADDDKLYGQGGNDTLIGGLGNDAVYGGDGTDVLEGGAGNDMLRGGGNANTTAQSAGSDTYKFALGSGVDHINDYDATVGNTDVALFSGVASTAVSALERKGNDLVLTYSASDQLIVDNYFHTDFFDASLQGYKIEQFKFSNGVTWAEAAIKAQVITMGTAFADIIVGYNDGTNRINGLDGNDKLYGWLLTDRIDGGIGDDTIYGQGGDDTLIGGLGADSLYGGLGSDIFDYNAVSESPVGVGWDIIRDFAGAGAALGDVIDLTTIDANSMLAGNQAFSWIGGAAFTAAGQLRYVGGVLQGSNDADAAAEFEIQVVGAPALVVGGAGTDILL